jgi:hypothetical protein
MDPPILEAPAETAVQEPDAPALTAPEDGDSLDIADGVLKGLFFAGVLFVILLLPIVIYLLW